MGRITLSVDDEVVKKVRRIAMEMDTTLTAMVPPLSPTLSRLRLWRMRMVFGKAVGGGLSPDCSEAVWKIGG